jgi:Fic family protein
VPTVDGVTAFVPNPLPREIDLEPPLIHLLVRAERSLGRLDGVTARLVNPYLLGSPLLRREAILSSRIEGTITTPEDLVLFEAGTPPPQEQRSQDALEVSNYVKAMQYALKRVRTLPISLRLITEIHNVLMRDVRGGESQPGEFRTSQNFVGHKGAKITEARFVPPPVPEMKTALHAFEKYLHLEPHVGTGDLASGPRDDISPLLVRLALAHYQFETIHPFRDGNGRVGRLLIPLLLISHDRLREPLLYMSAYFERHRSAYYDHLLTLSQTGQWTPWVEYFLRGVEETALESIDEAEALIALRDEWHERFQSARSSALLLKLIDHLFKSPSITIRRAASLLKVTSVSASHNVNKLVDAGILTERTGRKWGRIFVARDILKFMDRRTPRARPSRH